MLLLVFLAVVGLVLFAVVCVAAQEWHTKYALNREAERLWLEIWAAVSSVDCTIAPLFGSCKEVQISIAFKSVTKLLSELGKNGCLSCQLPIMDEFGKMIAEITLTGQVVRPDGIYMSGASAPLSLAIMRGLKRAIEPSVQPLLEKRNAKQRQCEVLAQSDPFSRPD